MHLVCYQKISIMGSQDDPKMTFDTEGQWQYSNDYLKPKNMKERVVISTTYAINKSFSRDVTAF